MPVIRKLVAVVMADVVSYSRLMERDEGGTHQRLRALHDELIAPKIAEHGGRTTLESEFELDFRTPRNEALLQEMDNDSRRAVALDSRDARAWFSRAMTLAFLGRFEAALEANDRAVALDPSRFSMQRSWLYVMSGQSEKALAEMAQRNARAGGVDTDLFLWCHVKVHLARYGEAIADCERAVASDNDYWIYLDLTAAYAETGDMTRAAAARAELMKRVPDFTLSRFDAKRFATHPVWIEEIRTRFIPGLRKAGVPE
jgi:tetratricopeptide (TPR) repeat protein